jgi:pilus assembly protein TadC
MTKLQIKSFVLQLICFVILFTGFRYLVANYTNLSGYWIPLTAFVIGTLLSPKFQAIKTKDGERLFMKWLFVKGIREIS